MNILNKRQLALMIQVALLIVVVALAGCGEKGQQMGGGFQMPPTPVETALVTLQPVTDRFATVGTIEASEAITVTSEIDGIITAIPFPEGGRVAQGELIAQLDDQQRSAEVQRARALYEQARATWQRVKTIVDQGAGAPQDLDDAVAALKVAEANLAVAQTYLDKTRITAAFTGLAGKRNVSQGAFLRAGTPITTLTRIDRLRVGFAVPERLLATLRQGATVTVSTPAFPDRQLIGTIDVIEPRLDPLTRNADVIAVVDNPERLLRPGMSATIEIILRERSGALTVPSEAVFVEGGQAFVYVVKGDTVATRAAVELGSRQPALVEVTSGLGEGQKVVKTGHQKLYEGARVAPMDGGMTGRPGGKSQEGGGAQ